MPYQGLVAGTRPATTLPPVAYISTGFIGCAWISHRQHRCCIPKIGVIGVRNKLRQQPMYSWPGTDATTGFVGCALFLAHADVADSTETVISESCIICVKAHTALTIIVLMRGENAIPRVGGRHQAGHYTATKAAYLHGLYPLRRNRALLFFEMTQACNVFAQDVKLDVDHTPHLDVTEVGVLAGIGDDGHGELVVGGRNDSE